MKRAAVVLGLVGALALVVFVFRRPPSSLPAQVPDHFPPLEEFTPDELEKILQHSPMGPPPADPTNAVADHPQAARLGQLLFFDARFSKDGKVSCSTCHPPSRSFADGKALPEVFSIDRNVPSLWNVGFNRWFFWDGRADSLWSQALKPMENPREGGGTRLQFVHLIRQDPRIRLEYEKVFGSLPDLSDPLRFPSAGGPFVRPVGSPLQVAWASMSEADQILVNRIFSNLGKAIAAYERLLRSSHSAFDIFVEGIRGRDPAKLSALSPQARKGLKLFVGKGNCRLCHSGPNFTDGEFHNIGIPPSRGGLTADRYAAIGELKRDPFNSKGPFSDDPDAGQKKLDYLWVHQDLWGQIKTPTLRNAAKTGPYMHQGQFRTLKEVVRYYSTLEGMVQVGNHERTILRPLTLTGDEASSLVAFLESLTDESIEERLLRPLE
jgi:cytochrome c peroxidase